MFPIVYLNGTYVAKENAALNVSDLSILRGYGIFDYFRYVDSSPIFLADHIKRFRNSASEMGLPLELSDSDLSEVVHQLIKRNASPDGGIRFVMTGGYAADGYTPSKPNLVAMAYPHKAPAAEQYENGCKVLIHHHQRQIPQVKTTDYIQGIRLLPVLKSRGYDFPLYVSAQGHVLESDRSNIFIIKNGVLITPAEDILLGITRKHLIALAQSLGISVVEQTVTLDNFLAADEAIIASSTKGAMPIVACDQGKIGTGQPGPMTKTIMKHWPDYCKGK